MLRFLKPFLEKKPRLVIIGEAHPLRVAEEFMVAGKLRVKKIEIEGKTRYVADIREGGEETRKSIQKIIKIIQKEADILKKEKINRLFLEQPATEETKNILSEFGDSCLQKFKSELDEKCERARAFKKLKQTLREQLETEKNMDWEAVEKYALAFKPSQTLKSMIKNHTTSCKKQPLGMFRFAPYDVAYKANVFDIIHIEDPKVLRQTDSAYMTLGMCRDLIKQYRLDDSSAIYILGELELIFDRAERDFLSFSQVREKIMCKNIINNYTPNSALRCGARHFKQIKEMLSEYFEIKPYEVTVER